MCDAYPKVINYFEKSYIRNFNPWNAMGLKNWPDFNALYTTEFERRLMRIKSNS